MPSNFNPIARRSFNRTTSSWWGVAAFGHSEALREVACRAPHAPYGSKYCFAFGKGHSKFRRATSAGEVLKRLGLRAPHGQDSALKATNRDLNPVGHSASLHVIQKRSPGGLWIDRVADVSRAAATQSMRRIIKSPIQTAAEHEIAAQLLFHSRGVGQQSRRPHGANARWIHDTIETDRLTESPALPAVAFKGLDRWPSSLTK